MGETYTVLKVRESAASQSGYDAFAVLGRVALARLLRLLAAQLGVYLLCAAHPGLGDAARDVGGAHEADRREYAEHRVQAHARRQRLEGPQLDGDQSARERDDDRSNSAAELVIDFYDP